MFAVHFLKTATRDLEKLDKSVGRRIVQRIQWLAENVETINPVALKGDLAGLCKLRDGHYRVIYEILREENKIMIHAVGHRKNVYRQS